ncbi:hypothetical protein FKM82_026293 [Ascaphus truei]
MALLKVVRNKGITPEWYCAQVKQLIRRLQSGDVMYLKEIKVFNRFALPKIRADFGSSIIFGVMTLMAKASWGPQEYQHVFFLPER